MIRRFLLGGSLAANFISLAKNVLSTIYAKNNGFSYFFSAIICFKLASLNQAMFIWS